MSICGLDFGTSNTTLGTIEDTAPVLAALENGQTTVPSAIFYEANGAVLIGRKAIAQNAADVVATRVGEDLLLQVSGGNVIRIISARKATKSEARFYP